MRTFRIHLVISASLLLPAGAVVTSEYGAAPGLPDNDPIWANVGVRSGGSTAIYLGNRYVLTAAHVGAGSVTFDGVSYSAESGSAQTLNNNGAAMMSEKTDLTVFRINGDPGLAPLRIGSTPLEAGSAVTMIGNGRNRAEAPVYGNVVAGTWSASSTPGNANGVSLLSSHSMGWGTNETDAAPGVFTLGSGPSAVSIHTYNTVFDANAGPTEAQAATYDSGGGMFYRRDGDWELAGVILAIQWHWGQNPGQVAVHGNRTYMADLSFYHSQLQPLLDAPDPGGNQPGGGPSGPVPEPGVTALLAGAMLTGMRRRRRL